MISSASGDHQDSETIQDLLNQLESPIADVEQLLGYLAALLDDLNLLPPLYKRFNTQPLPRGAVKPDRHLARIQRTLLQQILPTWDDALRRKKCTVLVDQFFCPDLFSNALSISGTVARTAYSVLLSGVATTLTQTPHSLKLLERLCAEYPLDRLYDAVYAPQEGDDDPGLPTRAKELAWSDCVRNLAMVPSKVANLLLLSAQVGRADGRPQGKGPTVAIPRSLENGEYFNQLSVRCEELISRLAQSHGLRGAKRQASIQPISYLIAKLVNVGLFPPSPPTSRTQPSFFQSTLPTIVGKIHLSNTADDAAYFTYWNDLLDNLPSALSLQSVLTSLFGSVEPVRPPLDDSAAARAKVREKAILLERVVGALTPQKGELWEVVMGLVLKRQWDLSLARVWVCWVSGAARGGSVNTDALEAFMDAVLELWTSTEHIKHSLLSQHQCASLLLLAASYFTPNSPPLQALSLSHMFIQGITKYLSHQDSAVRHCAMIVAEETARLCGKQLDFGGWEGEVSGKPWARQLRMLVRARDVDACLDSQSATDKAHDDVEVEEITTAGAALALDESEREREADTAVRARAHVVSVAEGYDSDDSLTGYASTSSSRSSSPSPEQLDEIEKDPSLNVGKKKVVRPVYLKQLGDLLRGSNADAQKAGPDDPHEADKIEMGLMCAEELIRKKANYGTELAENAVNLVYALLGLNDNYETPDFAAKRQGALNALVACAPRQSTPSIIEEFFKNQYSTDQRYVALNALAMGARELASLPIPESTVPPARIAFPSKQLPAAQHRKYIAGQADTSVVPLLMEGISREAIEHQKDTASSDRDPVLAREKVLKIKKRPGIAEVPPRETLLKFGQAVKTKTTFTQVAAEFFVAPLINRFWLFLREEQDREQRTAHMSGMQRYRGAGTGLILNPLVLAHFLRTVGVLVNAAQNAPEWLAVLAPDALELAVTVGTRPLSQVEVDIGDDGEEEGTKGEKEASVLSGALELALVVLDGSVTVDGGRTLGLDHTALLLGVQEWATTVFNGIEKGLKVAGGGGLQEVRVKRNTAGVLLKIEEITGRWRRSMLDWT